MWDKRRLCATVMIKAQPLAGLSEFNSKELAIEVKIVVLLFESSTDSRRDVYASNL